ncbi:hypothetical protein ACJMK2_036174 [Sinanodonta woodiana]|uniref:Uncharacterized protein n=1 Tax=Sinanodonta woodiana TaxID=1069815 RepID=A0ABD3WGM2_SINWO
MFHLPLYSSVLYNENFLSLETYSYFSYISIFQPGSAMSTSERASVMSGIGSSAHHSTRSLRSVRESVPPIHGVSGPKGPDSIHSSGSHSSSSSSLVN